MRYLLTILLFIGLQANGQLPQLGHPGFHAHNKFTPTVFTCGVSDTDACNFLTATKITDPTVKAAVGQLVSDLKSAGLWNRIVALYPFASDGIRKPRSEQHRYNLKDTAAYQLTFIGMILHTGSGADWDNTASSTNHALTGLNPALVLNDSSVHLSYYSRENTNAAHGDAIDMGALAGGRELFLTARNSGTFGGGAGIAVNGRTTAATSSAAGYFIGFTTPANTARYLYQNGSVVASQTGASSLTHVNAEMYLGALSFSNSSYGQVDRECAFASIGYGLTTEQAVTLSAIVNTYQTALSRNIY